MIFISLVQPISMMVAGVAKSLIASLSFIISASLISCSTPVETYSSSQEFDEQWAMEKLWEDGQAEVAHYAAEMKVYGKTRNFDYVHITVKEEFNKVYNVKTDDYDRDDLFSVFKVNKFARFETENYPYHFLTSVFIPRERLELMHKMTHTGQEWCGNTFKQFSLSEGGYEYDYNSYFDGYGDGDMFIEGNDLLWEDQLSTLLRSLKFKDGLQFSRRVVESQVNTRTRVPKIYDADFKVQALEDSWKVTVKFSEEKVNTYTFRQAYPNILIAQANSNGFSLALTEVSRYKYWR